MLLAGDVGGTKTTLIWFSRNASSLNPILRLRLETRKFSNIVELVQNGMRKAREQGIGIESLQKASFACAGAVIEDRVVTNNLPWPVDAATLAESLNLQRRETLLINDLVAAAASLSRLSDDDLLPLNDAVPKGRAPKALI